MGQFLLICACGGVGAVARFVLNTSIQRSWRKLFPLSTFIINVLASLLAGVAAAAYTYQTVNYYTYLLFVTGFLGGFSTFSSVHPSEGLSPNGLRGALRPQTLLPSPLRHCSKAGD